MHSGPQCTLCPFLISCVLSPKVQSRHATVGWAKSSPASARCCVRGDGRGRGGVRGGRAGSPLLKRARMGLRDQLGDNPATYDMLRFCWKTKHLGINGYQGSKKWSDDCTDSVLIFIACLAVFGTLVILWCMRLCVICCPRKEKQEEEEEEEDDDKAGSEKSEPKKDK